MAVAAYLELVLPQMSLLVPRALFVYDDAYQTSGQGGGGGGAAVVQLVPPARALDGITAYVVMRLLGALSDLALASTPGQMSSSKSETAAARSATTTTTTRKTGGGGGIESSGMDDMLDTYYPQRRQLGLGIRCQRAASSACSSPRCSPRSCSPPRRTPRRTQKDSKKDEATDERRGLRGALVALHALLVLVPPTPGLLRALTRHRTSGGDDGDDDTYVGCDGSNADAKNLALQLFTLGASCRACWSY